MKTGQDPKSIPHPKGKPPQAYARLLPQRFIDKVLVDEDTGCWLWIASQTRFGYGRIGRGGRTEGWTTAHRFAWEKVIGPTTPGLEFDHLCRRPPCCNPVHIEEVTKGENARRGKQANSSGVCRSGRHPWVEGNILQDGRYQRCRECRNEWDRLRNNPDGNLPPHMRTHCPQGHPYSGDNLYVKPTGSRECRTCHRDYERRKYRERKGLPL